MYDLDPRSSRPIPDPEHSRDPRHEDAWRETNERGMGSLWPIAIVAAVFLLGLFYFGTTTHNKQSSTQVSQNIERPQ
jgi:hypothetical protein